MGRGGGFPCCSTREDLSIDVSITNVGLILTKLVTSFLGVRTDRHGFGNPIWKHVGTQKISTRSSKLRVSCRSLRLVITSVVSMIQYNLKISGSFSNWAT